MNAERIAEAVKKVTSLSELVSLEDEKEGIKTLLDLANSHLSALKDGVPEQCIADDTGVSGNHCSNWANGFNACRSQMLALVVQRDREIAELKHKTTCLNEALEQANSYWESAEAKLQALSARAKDVEGIKEILNNPKYWCPSKNEQWRRLATAISAWLQKGEGR